MTYPPPPSGPAGPSYPPEGDPGQWQPGPPGGQWQPGPPGGQWQPGPPGGQWPQQPAGGTQWPPPPAGGPWASGGASWPGQPGGSPYGLTSDERTWGMVSHAGCILVGLLSGGFLAWLAPLIVLLTKGKESAFVRRHAAESLNFQLTMLGIYILAWILWLVFIGVILSIAQTVFWLIVVIMASVAANDGREYRYPLTLRLVS